MGSDRVFFFDTTLRDGEQSPGCSMTVAEKVRMAHALSGLGVDVMEAGFAVASEGDFMAIDAISREIHGVTIASLARARQEDIETAARALEKADRSRLHIFLASSDIHLQHKLGMTREQALEQADRSVRLATRYFDEVEFSPEDATRTDHDFLCQIVAAAVRAGASVINLPDTVGYAIPNEYGALFAMLAERVPELSGVTLSCHCHDDLGLATANSLAAIAAGARQVECTINGIGERAGNAALEEVAAAMMVRPEKYPFTNHLMLDRLYPTSRLLSELIGVRPSPNKAVVGANAFAHEAGIHQHGVLANPLTYEIMTPASVGVPHNRMVLGKHSGRHALAHRLEQLGHPLEGRDLELAYERFNELADHKKLLHDEDLLRLISAKPGNGEDGAALAATHLT